MNNNQNNKYRGFITDTSNIATWKLDDETGFLTSAVVLARIGVQQYFGYELGLKDRAIEKINVYRSPEEVFCQTSVDGYINLTVVDDHPAKPVTTDNVKDLQVGSVSNVVRDGDFLKGIATIKDKEQIEKIMSGKKELSVGYSQQLKPILKTVDGLKCEFEQTEIKPNHLAIVDTGRCGPACRILNDNNNNIGDKLPTITIDSIDYKIEDSQLFQAIQKTINDAEEQQESFEKKEKSFEERLKDLENEKEKAIKEKEEALALKEASEKEKLDDSQLEKLINDAANEKAELLAQSKLILGDKMPDCIDCDLEIMKAVIGDRFSEDEVKDKSPEYTTAYITALYDAAVKAFESGRESIKEFGADLSKDKEGKIITRDSIRTKYITNLTTGVK